MKPHDPIRTLTIAAALIALAGCGTNPPPADAPASPLAAQSADPSTRPAAAPAPTSGETDAATSPASHPDDAEPATAIPATAGAIWTAIDEKRAALAATVRDGDLRQVHHQAFAIRDLVAALPAHAQTGTADAQAKLTQGAGYVATLATRLDADGDGNDRSAAQADFAKLQAILDGLPRAK